MSMAGAAGAAVVSGLVGPMVDRLAAAARRKFDQRQRARPVSPQLDPVESKVQAALGASIRRRDDLPRPSALVDALEDRESIAVESSGLVDASDLSEAG